MLINPIDKNISIFFIVLHLKLGLKTTHLITRKIIIGYLLKKRCFLFNLSKLRGIIKAINFKFQ